MAHRTLGALNAQYPASRYLLHAWVMFDASSGSPVVLASDGLSSIADNGTGDFTVTWCQALASGATAGYVYASGTASTGSGHTGIRADATSPNNTSVRLTTWAAAVVADNARVGVGVLRDY